MQAILQGHLPGNLTEQGKEQVRKAAERLAEAGVEFKCIVSSDLKRAMDSAHIIAERLHLPITPMQELRERDWGIYTGRRSQRLPRSTRLTAFGVSPTAAQRPTWESYSAPATPCNTSPKNTPPTPSSWSPTASLPETCSPTTSNATTTKSPPSQMPKSDY